MEKAAGFVTGVMVWVARKVSSTVGVLCGKQFENGVAKRVEIEVGVVCQEHWIYANAALDLETV